MTDLTEGSFEDTITIVKFDCDFNSSSKKGEHEHRQLALIVLIQLLVAGFMFQNTSSNQLLITQGMVDFMLCL